MTALPNDRETLLDLLAMRACGTLTDRDHDRLDEMLASSEDGLSHGYFDHAAAALSVAFASLNEDESLPDGVRDRCAQAFRTETFDQSIEELSSADQAQSADADTAPIVQTPPRPLRFTTSEPTSQTGPSRAWLVAASLAMIAAGGWWQAIFGGGQLAPVTPSAARDAMVASGASSSAWAPWGEQSEAELTAVSGSVVWDAERQEGYMSFVGLPENDPAKMRYQLWIVDTSRGEPLAVPPVDGGVFDIPAGGGEVVVPIQAKLPVGNAAVFAITREGPDGAVVSERRPEQLVLIASAG